MSAAMLNYNPIMKEDLMDIEDIDAELHEEATYYENPAVLLALLDAGANVEARDGNDWTPLHYAAGFNYNPAVLLALLKAGADTDARDSYDVTPLHYAVSGNPNPDVTHALLDASANPDVQGTTTGSRLLYMRQ